MEHITSYLDHLKFDQPLAETWHGKYLKSIRIVLLLVFTVILLGIGSYLNLPKRLNPEINIPIVIISTALPGAGPTDVESQVTEPLENAVTGVSGANTVTSTSQDNVSIISIEFSSSTDKNRALSDVQAAVNSASDLPEDATTPTVRIVDFEDQPVWTFAITTSNVAGASTGDTPSLYRFTQALEDDIEDLSVVDRVNVQGRETEEVQVLLNMEAIRTRGIDPFQLSGTITRSLSSFPAGTVNGDTSSFTLAIDPLITDVADIRNLTIATNGQTVRLGEIATVWQRPKPDQKKTYLARSRHSEEETTKNPDRSQDSNGILRLSPVAQDDKSQDAVVFSVFKTKIANIDQAAIETEKLVEEKIKEKNDQFTVHSLVNTGEEIATQFTDLTHEFMTTLLLIFITLLVFLGIRQALVVSFTVPLTFLWTFAVMRVTGITLNFLSLFSLLLSLGLLVDDAVVVVTAMTAYYRTGKFTPYQTALLVWRDFIVPIWTTTITTVWAFIPLLLASGIIGEFIKTIPIVVSASLLTSTAIAVLVTLPLMMVVLQTTIPTRVRILLRVLATLALLAGVWWLIPNNPLAPIILLVFAAYLFIAHSSASTLPQELAAGLNRIIPKAMSKRVPSGTLRHWLSDGIINIPRLASAYERAMVRILRGRHSKRMIIISVIIFSLFSYLLLPLGFVVNEFFPKADTEYLYASLELPAGSTIAQSNIKAQAMVGELAKTPGVLFVTAEAGQSAPTEMGGGGTGSNQILFSFILPKLEEQTITSQQIATELRKKYASVPDGTFTVIEISGGPPAGADLQIKLRGEDLVVLDRYADQIIAYLKEQPGVASTQKSIKGGVSKLSFVPDQEKMTQHGVTIEALGGALRGFASGISADTIKLDGETEDITIRTDADTHAVEDIGRIMIPTRSGNLPLSAFGTLTLKTNPTLITREDGKRTLSVSAGVVRGFSVSGENKKMEDFARTLNLPPGYEWQTGGVNEENEKSVQSILQAMILSVVLILATMVVQFNSFRKAIIVLLVIPLAISGVFLVFALTGTSLSFPSLIGVLALFGIVVNNSMMIVDKINQNQRTGMKLIPAISDACASRVEPILLTKLLTIMGLLPITLSDPFWRGLGGAIISGILFSSMIMLFFIPTVYYLWYKGEEE